MLVPINQQPALTFDDIMRQADVLAQSRIIPQAYRQRSPDIVAAGLAGIAFGWDVMTSLRNYHVIEGTASLKPEAMLGLVRRAGHSVTIRIENSWIEPGRSDAEATRAAIATGRRNDSGDEMEVKFSRRDAELAGLAGKKNWKQYEEAMLTWRAVSGLCRQLFPDVVLGAGYMPEEIGAEVTGTGEPVEPDPFADPNLTVAEAKRYVLTFFEDDKALAKNWWDSYVEQDVEQIRESELHRLMKSTLLVECENDIVDADIVEDDAHEDPPIGLSVDAQGDLLELPGEHPEQEELEL